MKKSIKLLYATGIVAIIFSCNRKAETNQTTETIASKTVDSVMVEKTEVKDSTFYQSETTSETTALKLRSFIVKDYLKAEDLRVIEPKDRKFSFYEIDLNGDTKNEYLINLQGNYFRGTGGGTFLLLSDDLKLINNFTVTNEPIFRSSHKTNGWNDLILWGDSDEKSGVKNYIHLKYDKAKGKYPSNPSLLKKNVLAPSGHDFVMWQDQFSKAKIFEF